MGATFACEGDSLDRDSLAPNDLNRCKRLAATVRRVCVPRAGVQSMGSKKASWGKLVSLLPVKTRSPARLRIEESTSGRFEKKLVRAGTCRSNVHIEGLVTELRCQHAVASREITVLSVQLVAALMIIRRGWLGRKW